jgi:hypothetical protein
VYAGGDAPESTASKPEALREILSADEGARRAGRVAFCAPSVTREAVEYFPCALSEFLATGDEKRFLDKIPLAGADVSSVWKVDEVLSREKPEQGSPSAVLGEPTFIRALIRALGDLAKRGSAGALERMLLLQEAADGWMAEEAAQANLDVFSRFPSVLVDNWTTVEKHGARVGFGTTDFADQRSEIEQRYKTYCADSKRRASDCEQAVRFLARD